MKLVTIVIALLATTPDNLTAQRAAPTAHVSYADLNLSSEAGVKALDRRIAAAARAVCPDPIGKVELARLAMSQRCTVRAVDSARMQRNRIVAASTKQMLADRRP